MPAEQYGRWTSTDDVDTSQASDPAAAVALACTLHALRDLHGCRAKTAAAVVTIARPGGTVLGHFTAAGQDAENAAQHRAVRNGRGAAFSTPPCERIRVRVRVLGSGSPSEICRTPL